MMMMIFVTQKMCDFSNIERIDWSYTGLLSEHTSFSIFKIGWLDVDIHHIIVIPYEMINECIIYPWPRKFMPNGFH